MNFLNRRTSRRATLVALLFSAAIAGGCATSSDSGFDPVVMDTVEIDPAYPPSNVELSFNSAGARLPAYLMIANGRGPHPTVVLLHGYPGNEKNLDLAQSLRRASFNVLFFHYRGAWGAQGEFSFANVSRDVGAALDFLRANATDYRVDQLRLSLVGHSMGGFAALHAGARDQRVDCVVGLAAANLGEYAARGQEALEGYAAYSDGLFMLHGWSGSRAVTELMANPRALDLRGDAAGLAGKSVLLISGLQDQAVPVDVQRRLASAYQQQSRIDLTALEINGDHSFSANRIQLQRTVIGWMAGRCR